ncbi:Cupredoxin [Truncatella angustata]|uniref:Cupredoxin n=1 Tax=Truncatella angustata TaxID=152316 RepID=A0A9P8UWU7_9PEZI|nr:Cupredoxin [Truncatella angustata]KAH6659817.1 Cupredoxin [Truncatella angustata]
MRGHRASGSTSRLMEGDIQSIAYIDQKQTTRNQVPLWLFVACCVCFFVITLTLSLVLGLERISRPQNTLASVSFDYNSYYGISKNLNVVHIDKLINSTELNLRTGFVASADTTTRDYTFNITQGIAAPDGFQKPMILVNGQSPGPLVEANAGDMIRVHVNNQMDNSSTTIHWHGLNQQGSAWMDGVAGISQCGIPSGQNFTYEFVVKDQRGTYWWHAHSSVQYTDGIYGPIVIRDPSEMVPETDEERVLFVGDLYHTYGSVLLGSYLNSTSTWVPFESGVEPLADNILINGQHTYNCSVESSTYPPDPASPIASNCTGGQLYHTKVHKGQRIRLRLINSSSFLSYWFSIDNHTLSIVELDGVEIEPISARGVYLNIGQRVSAVVTANQTAGNYYIRATMPQTCFVPYAPYTSTALENAGYAARGILSYDHVALDAEPVGVRGNVSNPYGVDNNGIRGDVWEGCDDMPFDMPRPMRKLDAVDVGDSNYQYIEYMFRQAQDVNRIFINKTAYSALKNNATIWKTLDQQFDPSREGSYHSWDLGLNQQVLLIPDGGKGAQVVINSLDAMEHPWHMHGHTFQIVGWGPGPYGASANSTTWNPSNPMRRDTVTVPAQSHVVLRFMADNPGVWALHCHVAWHMEGGMFVSLAERPRDLAEMISDMDPETRRKAMGFCGM